MQESSAFPQTSCQCEDWRGLKREGGERVGEGSTEELCTSENLEELGLKAMEFLGGYEGGIKGSCLHN